MMHARKKPNSRAANWAAVRDAVLGLLLLVAIKLAWTLAAGREFRLAAQDAPRKI